MSDSVQKIKDKLDIIDVISPYTELHKAGKNFKGKSPFTSEKTPSFYVSPDEGLYYCFSTNQGGDMFTFIQTIEGVDFKESLKLLADKAGVELVREDPKKRDAREQQLAILDEATKFYHKTLRDEPEAEQYLKDRGITEKTIINWRLGYAPGPPKHGWRHVKEHLENMGYKVPELLAAGLIKQADGGKQPYDVFRDRLMFPMANASGKVVAFSGRILTKDSEAPKYVNSPETELYKKSELLFGYDRAREGIRKYDFSLIVEGQFDVVMCHQAGYTNAVAVSGTALTPQHVRLLERLSSNVLLALDADRAGIEAMKKSAKIMLTRGMDVKVVRMSEGEDPADIINRDPAEFKKLVGKSMHIIEFLAKHLKAIHEDERKYKLKVREEIIPLLALIPNRIDQEHFESVLAKISDGTKESIHFEVERVREETPEAELQTNPTEHPPAQTHQENKNEDELVAYLLAAAKNHDLAQKTQLLEKLTEYTQKSISTLKDEADPKTASKHVFYFDTFVQNEPERVVIEDLEHKLLLLQSIIGKKQLKKLRLALQEKERSGEEEAVEKTLIEISNLQNKLKNSL